jgi:hypothetical protein
LRFDSRSTSDECERLNAGAAATDSPRALPFEDVG